MSCTKQAHNQRLFPDILVCCILILSDYGFREHRVRYIHRVKAFAGIKGHREINQDVFLDQETRDQHPVQEPTTPGVPGELV